MRRRASGFRAQGSGFGVDTWRFMGSYKWGYKSPNMVISIVTLLITLLITTLQVGGLGSWNEVLGVSRPGLSLC